jgi:orotidine-5'-phosphate decarboxylase
MFADRLIAATRAQGHPLCVGLDPNPQMIPALFGPAGSLEACGAFFEAVLAALAGRVAVVKPQIGLFEAYGPAGYALCADLGRQAQGQGALVILDAKRGDIGSTADGYAAAALGPAPGFDADCVTVNPYMGLDTLEPYLPAVRTRAKGIAVLVRTSNPGARDLQELDCGGAPLWVRTAQMLAPLVDAHRGETGFSCVMVVAGATAPDQAARIRAVLPAALQLVPGYGAQGASATDAVAGFVAGPQGLEGGVVNASRGVLYPRAAGAAATLAEWRSAFTDNLDAVIADLSAAVRI